MRTQEAGFGESWSTHHNNAKVSWNLNFQHIFSNVVLDMYHIVLIKLKKHNRVWWVHTGWDLTLDPTLALLGWLYNMYQSLGSSAVWWVFWLGWISLVRFVLLVDFNLITQETASFPKKMKVLTRQWHQTNSQNNWRKPCMASQSRDMNRI